MTNSTLTISNVLQSNTGSYQCRADNDVGSATSSAAILSIASTYNYYLTYFISHALLVNKVLCMGKTWYAFLGFYMICPSAYFLRI